MAVSCSVNPMGMLGFAGPTTMDTRVAEVTVRFVVPDIDPRLAVIVVVPAATGVARPYVVPTVATAESEDFQVTDVVRSFVVLSEYVPVAVNCWLTPTAMLGFVGSSAMETSMSRIAATVAAPGEYEKHKWENKVLPVF